LYEEKKHKECPPLSSKEPPSIFPRKYQLSGGGGGENKWRPEITQI
jgi:hypothetical protein